MQTRITINQDLAMPAGLSLQDAAIFARFWAMSPEADPDHRWHDHRIWFPATPESVATALPLVNYKPKTVRASILKLVNVGLLDRLRIDGAMHYAVSDLGRRW